MNIGDKISEQFCAKPKGKKSFSAGQSVRVIKHIECNMPAYLDYWLDTVCEVVNIIPRGFSNREWVYELRHPNGSLCEFKIDELDKRYIKKENK